MTLQDKNELLRKIKYYKVLSDAYKDSWTSYGQCKYFEERVKYFIRREVDFKITESNKITIFIPTRNRLLAYRIFYIIHKDVSPPRLVKEFITPQIFTEFLYNDFKCEIDKLLEKHYDLTN